MKIIARYFLDAIKKYRKEFITSLFLIVMVSLLNMLLPFGLRLYLEEVVSTNNIDFLLIGLLCFFVFLIVATFFKSLWYVSLDHFGGRYIEELLIKLETTLAKTTMSNIEKKKYNVLKNILYTDVLDVFRVIGHHLPSFVGSILVMVFTLGLAFYYDGKLAGFIFLSIIVGFVVSYISRTLISKLAKNTNLKLKELNSKTNEFIDSLLLIQTNNILPYFKKVALDSTRSFIKTAKREDFIIYMIGGSVENYYTLFKIALSAILALPYIDGSLVNLAFFTMLSNIVLNEAAKCESLFRQINKSCVSFMNIEEIMSFQPRQGSEELNHIERIEFKNVSFSYQEGTQPVFEKLNCDIEKGNRIYLEGFNGSGKSTFIKLILGLYSPKMGEILLNGKPINCYSLEDLNHKILYLGQDEVLLNTDIKQYLEIMSSSDDLNEVLNKSKEMFGFDDFEREITHEGQSLSVGQKKKVILTKMLLRLSSASLIILDEVTAGLDLVSKQNLYKFLKEYVEENDKIFIFIDHEKVFESLSNKKWLIEEGRIERIDLFVKKSQIS